MRDALWTVCAWVGAVSLGCCGVVVLWLAYVMLLDRWRNRIRRRCRLCTAPELPNVGLTPQGWTIGASGYCTPCERVLRIPREVMG